MSISTIMDSYPAPLSCDQKSYSRHLHSRHDNRHSLQDTGAYLDMGFGKKKSPYHQGQHHRPGNMLQERQLQAWSESQQPIEAVTKAAYKTPPISCCTSSYSLPDNVLVKFHTVTKNSFHRYPHQYNSTIPRAKHIAMETSSWLNTQAYVTPLWVLAATQKPLLPKNTWIYSYHGFK